MYSETTRDIEVRVRPIFERKQSVPFAPVYTWAYEIQILNHSSSVVQLLYRYWKVVDEEGVVREVRGSGVVGQNPILNPGDTFTYSSFTQLPTATGYMEGQYEMLCSSGTVERFMVDIPRFQLAPPVRLVAVKNDSVESDIPSSQI